jgi:nitrate/nitrite-specific signal transduction histidine kinase
MLSTVKSKIIFISIIVIFMIIVANVITSSLIFSKEYSLALQSETVVIGQSLKFQLDRLLRLGIALEEITGFEEQCQEIVNRYEEISHALVTDANGKILFHNDPSQQGKTIDDDYVLEEIKECRQAVLSHPEGTQKYFDVIIPVYNKNEECIGAVVLGFPEEVISNKVMKLIIFSAGTSLIFFILGLLLMILALSQWVSKPLDKLVSIIDYIREKKDLSKKVDIETKDELGNLASAFNEMIEDLKKSKKELENYSKTLEKKVKERTKELESKNEELKEFNKMAVGRELKMVELKKRIKELEKELSKK